MYILTEDETPPINVPVVAYDGEDYYMAIFNGKEWLEHTVFTRTVEDMGLDLIQYAQTPLRWMYP